MRRALYQGKEVLATGEGQCMQCRSPVLRVLIAAGNGREWHAAQVGHFGYSPHICGPSPKPEGPMRKAA